MPPFLLSGSAVAASCVAPAAAVQLACVRVAMPSHGKDEQDIDTIGHMAASSLRSQHPAASMHVPCMPIHLTVVHHRWYKLWSSRSPRPPHSCTHAATPTLQSVHHLLDPPSHVKEARVQEGPNTPSNNNGGFTACCWPSSSLMFALATDTAFGLRV